MLYSAHQLIPAKGPLAAAFGGDREHIFVAGDSARGNLPQFNCIWVAVAGHFVPGWLYNIGTTVLNGGVSMVVFFFVNKIIFPEGEPQKK